MNGVQHFRLPVVAVLLALWMALAGAAEGMAPNPVAVAESETFEAVGRLSDEGLSWFVDRADSNAPVLDARLEVEFDGKTQLAKFRPEHGDYLITDAEWLKALRQPGEHPLALTLLAGEDSDLLAASLDVHADQVAPAAGIGRNSLWGVVVVGILLSGLWLRRRQAKGGRS